MPELPEVETVRRGLARLIVGRGIVAVVVRVPKVVAVGPRNLAPARKTETSVVRGFRRGLTGRRVVAVRRRAKLLVFELDGGWNLLVHLKISGQLIVQRPGESRKSAPLFNGPQSTPLLLPHRHTAVTFHLSDGTSLYYNDVRRFGYLRLVRDRDLPAVEAIARAGVEPFSPAFTLTWFLTLLASERFRRIKQVLLDPARIAGIGNIYADEILFAARVRPTRRVRTLSVGERRSVFRAIRPKLSAAIRSRGSSVGDFFTPSGRPGTFGDHHRVYGRAGLPCQRCGTMLRRTVVGGRGTVYCPHCQR
jgi:formamidopyrimidine-DNA glycosylase